MRRLQSHHHHHAQSAGAGGQVVAGGSVAPPSAAPPPPPPPPPPPHTFYHEYHHAHHHPPLPHLPGGRGPSTTTSPDGYFAIPPFRAEGSLMSRKTKKSFTEKLTTKLDRLARVRDSHRDSHRAYNRAYQEVYRDQYGNLHNLTSRSGFSTHPDPWAAAVGNGGGTNNNVSPGPRRTFHNVIPRPSSSRNSVGGASHHHTGWDHMSHSGAKSGSAASGGAAGGYLAIHHPPGHASRLASVSNEQMVYGDLLYGEFHNFAINSNVCMCEDFMGGTQRGNKRPSKKCKKCGFDRLGMDAYRPMAPAMAALRRSVSDESINLHYSDPYEYLRRRGQMFAGQQQKPVFYDEQQDEYEDFLFTYRAAPAPVDQVPEINHQVKEVKMMGGSRQRNGDTSPANKKTGSHRHSSAQPHRTQSMRVMEATGHIHHGGGQANRLTDGRHANSNLSRPGQQSNKTPGKILYQEPAGTSPIAPTSEAILSDAASSSSSSPASTPAMEASRNIVTVNGCPPTNSSIIYLSADPSVAAAVRPGAATSGSQLKHHPAVLAGSSIRITTTSMKQTFVGRSSGNANGGHKRVSPYDLIKKYVQESTHNSLTDSNLSSDEEDQTEDKEDAGDETYDEATNNNDNRLSAGYSHNDSDNFYTDNSDTNNEECEDVAAAFLATTRFKDTNGSFKIAGQKIQIYSDCSVSGGSLALGRSSPKVGGYNSSDNDGDSEASSYDADCSALEQQTPRLSARDEDGILGRQAANGGDNGSERSTPPRKPPRGKSQEKETIFKTWALSDQNCNVTGDHELIFSALVADNAKMNNVGWSTVDHRPKKQSSPLEDGSRATQTLPRPRTGRRTRRRHVGGGGGSSSSSSKSRVSNLRRKASSESQKSSSTASRSRSFAGSRESLLVGTNELRHRGICSNFSSDIITEIYGSKTSLLRHLDDQRRLSCRSLDEDDDQYVCKDDYELVATSTPKDDHPRASGGWPRDGQHRESMWNDEEIPRKPNFILTGPDVDATTRLDEVQMTGMDAFNDEEVSFHSIQNNVTNEVQLANNNKLMFQDTTRLRMMSRPSLRDTLQSFHGAGFPPTSVSSPAASAMHGVPGGPVEASPGHKLGRLGISQSFREKLTGGSAARPSILATSSSSTGTSSSGFLQRSLAKKLFSFNKSEMKRINKFLGINNSPNSEHPVPVVDDHYNGSASNDNIYDIAEDCGDAVNIVNNSQFYLADSSSRERDNSGNHHHQPQPSVQSGNNGVSIVGASVIAVNDPPVGASTAPNGPVPPRPKRERSKSFTPRSRIVSGGSTSSSNLFTITPNIKAINRSLSQLQSSAAAATVRLVQRSESCRKLSNVANFGGDYAKLGPFRHELSANTDQDAESTSSSSKRTLSSSDLITIFPEDDERHSFKDIRKILSSPIISAASSTTGSNSSCSLGGGSANTINRSGGSVGSANQIYRPKSQLSNSSLAIGQAIKEEQLPTAPSRDRPEDASARQSSGSSAADFCLEHIYEEIQDMRVAERRRRSASRRPLPPLPGGAVEERPAKRSSVSSSISSSTSETSSPVKSIFEGASKYDILNYLEDARERGLTDCDLDDVEEDPPEAEKGREEDEEDDEELEDDETEFHQNGHREKKTSNGFGSRHKSNRISNISTTSSDSAHSSGQHSITAISSCHDDPLLTVVVCGEERDINKETKVSNVDIERNDSGLGSETGRNVNNKFMVKKKRRKGSRGDDGGQTLLLAQHQPSKDMFDENDLHEGDGHEGDEIDQEAPEDDHEEDGAEEGDEDDTCCLDCDQRVGARNPISPENPDDVDPINSSAAGLVSATDVDQGSAMDAPGGQMVLLCGLCERRRVERKEIITEIIDTEIKYGRDLRIIQEEFYRPMLVASLLTQEQLANVFLNVEELIQVNARFTEALKDAIEIALDQGDEDLCTVSMGKLFLEATSMLGAFKSYCTRQGAASTLLASLEREKELLRIFLRVSQMENTILRRMNLSSFLMVPVQRVTRYPLLLSRLLKVTPDHHPDKDTIQEARERIEHGLDSMNQETLRGSSTTKLWRRISMMNPPYRRDTQPELIGTTTWGVRKMVLETLGWSREPREDVTFVLEGRMLYTQPTDSTNWRNIFSGRMAATHLVLTTLGGASALTPTHFTSRARRPTQSGGADERTEDAGYGEFGVPQFPRETGCREAALLLLKEKAGLRYSPVRDPLMLARCVVCWEPEWDDCFEITDFTNKESFIFKGEDIRQTVQWYQTLQFFSLGLGSWRRRRNGLANIMINGMVRTEQLDSEFALKT